VLHGKYEEGRIVRGAAFDVVGNLCNAGVSAAAGAAAAAAAAEAAAVASGGSNAGADAEKEYALGVPARSWEVCVALATLRPTWQCLPGSERDLREPDESGEGGGSPK